MPVERLLLHVWWTAGVLMAVTLISDYALTLWGAKLYREAGRVQVVGSYESVPLFQHDIDTERLVSGRFVIVLLITSGALGAIAKFRGALEIDDRFYMLFAGFLLLVEVPVHVRHAYNVVRFSLLKRSGAADGKIAYARWFALRVASADYFIFAILLGLTFAATGSAFFVGGALRCVMVGVFQLVLSWHARSQPAHLT